MSKKKVYIIIALIFILAFISGNLVFPQFLKLPRFPNIPFKLGLDLQGGTHLIYEADLSQIEEKERGEAMSGLRDVIERRVDLFGVMEPLVQTQGERLIVELAGIKDPAEAIRMIGQTPYLEFKETFSPEEKEEVKKNFSEGDISKMMESYKQQTGKDITKDEFLEMITSNLLKPTELTGKYLKRADITFDTDTGKPQISLQFKEEGEKLFAEITKKNIGKPLAIFLDEKSIVDTDGDGEITDNDLYAPIVQEEIVGGKAVITGEMDINRAKEIVKRLNSGALPVKIGSPISQQTVGPILGKISLEQSLQAGILGFLAILLFMILFYRIPGFFASISLLIYVLFMLALIKLIPITLTLAGIAGFLLSMGMAVDANILIFSRMREGLREGKNYLISLEEGIRRAWPSIRDGNFTTILVGLILFSFGTGFVKGFSLTLIIGNLLGMFTAIVITNNFLRLFAKTKLEKIKWFWK